MNRKATAVWTRTLREGKGRVSTESGALSNAAYSFETRFENEQGTNPEELIAAAHASCFSMALANELQKAKITPHRLTVDADVTLEKDTTTWSISKVHLNISANISESDHARFEKIAQTAKENCPVSRLLKAEITLDSHLDATVDSDEHPTTDEAGVEPHQADGMPKQGATTQRDLEQPPMH